VNIYEVKYENSGVYYVEGETPEDATAKLEKKFKEQFPTREFNVLSVKKFRSSRRDA